MVATQRGTASQALTVTAPTYRSRATSTATARTTSSGTPPARPPTGCGTSSATAPTPVPKATTQDLITGVPLVGDFDGDRIDDVFFYGPGAADDSLWRGRPDQTFRRTSPTVNGWYSPVALDATGDGRDDILWYVPGGTAAYRWEFRSDATFQSRALTLAALTGRPVVGDFDGDGAEDVLLAAPGVLRPTRSGTRRRRASSVQRVSVNGSYAIAAGPMDSTGPGRPTTCCSWSATGADFLWLGATGRTFASGLRRPERSALGGVEQRGPLAATVQHQVGAGGVGGEGAGQQDDGVGDVARGREAPAGHRGGHVGQAVVAAVVVEAVLGGHQPGGHGVHPHLRRPLHRQRLREAEQPRLGE